MTQEALHRPLYTADLLVNALSTATDRPMLHLLGGPVLSAGDVRDETSRFVQALASLGVRRGTRVGLISPNKPEVLHVSHAVQLLAAVYVPMHPLGGLADHLDVIRDSGIEVLVFDADRFAARADEIGAELPDLKLASFGDSDIATNLSTLAQTFAPEPLVAPEVGPSDIMRLGYSGGTTGKPKAIPSIQRVGINVLQIMLTDWEWPAVPNVLTCTPLSHAGSALFLPTLLKGGTIVVQPGFEPVAVMEIIEKYRINCMMLVPTMIYALLDHPRFGEFDLSSLETVFYGASAISPARLKEAIERIGPVFQQFYGQSEAPMALTILRKAEHDITDMRRLASCGRPTPWVNLKLLDAEGQPVPDGEPGEICVRGRW